MIKFSRLILLLCSYFMAMAQDTTWSSKMAATAMAKWPTGTPGDWNYEQGLVLKSIERKYENVPDQKYYQYIKNKIDFFVPNTTGNINTYSVTEYNIDNIASGMSLLFLHNATGTNKYKLAADRIRGQITTHPRTVSGGFWHKNIYPNQMWLDGLYMAEPFYAQYSLMYNQPADFDDVTKQFKLMYKKSKDNTTGLMYHGWDESKQQQWANPVTGCSPSFWGRSIGWYVMGLVDVLDYLPQTHQDRDSLVTIFRDEMSALIKYQNTTNGLWYQVVDKGTVAGNYLEASASCMFVYALAKGSRKGYLDISNWDYAKKAYNGIISTFIVTDAQSKVHLNGTCVGTGLGGTPYRDGSFAYYTGVARAQDDPKGVGAFILASVEMEKGMPVVSNIDNSNTFNNGLRIFPNPVQNVLTISDDAHLDTSYNVKLYNNHQKVMYSGTGSTIDMEAYPSGIYLLEVSDNKGNRSLEKIVKY